MDSFFPFIHEIKKKEWEPEPLFLELIPPPKEKKEDKSEDKSIVIIDIL